MIRFRELTDAEVSQAKQDGRHCVVLDVPGQPDEYWRRWCVLEEWDACKGAWVEAPLVRL